MSRLARILGALATTALLAAPALVAGQPQVVPPKSVAYVPLPQREEAWAPVKSYAELRFKGVERQSLDLSCGAAALATLLHSYFGLPIDETTVIRGIFANASPDEAKDISTSGFSMLELKHFIESRGLIAGGYKSTHAEDLRKLRAPVIALVDSRGYKHFVVIRSVRGDVVAFADPVFGNRSEPLSTFAKRWDGVFLVAVWPGHRTNAAFMEAPPGQSDPRAVQLLVSKELPRPLVFLPGDFF